MREFWLDHPDTEQPLLVWYNELSKNDYRSSAEILGIFANARSIGMSRYIFNIKGNKYRLVVKINFELNTVWIRFIGTHDEYNKINALSI